MLMTNDNIKFFPHDRFMKYTVLRLVPAWVTPNQMTILRFFLTPFVLYFLWIEHWPIAMIFFLLAALTDAMDGSLARVRRQITLWGTIADPMADKLLIGSVVVLFVAREVNPIFAAIIIFIELLIAAAGWWRSRRGSYTSANNYGKLKMLFQVIGVTLLFIAKLLGLPLVVPFATGTLAVAIVFAIVSLLTYGI